MTIREAIEVHKGNGPGKFEGEGPEARYYWDAILNGEGDMCERHTFDGDGGYDSPCAMFEPTAEETEAFDLRPGYEVHVSEDSHGFVHCISGYFKIGQ